MSVWSAIPVFAGVAVALAAVAGMLRARDLLSRLHFLTPITTVAGPLIGLGLVLANGWSLGSGAIALTVVVLALTGPVVQSATARLLVDR